jgi:prefoldin beta subunit
MAAQLKAIQEAHDKEVEAFRQIQKGERRRQGGGTPRRLLNLPPTCSKHLSHSLLSSVPSADISKNIQLRTTFQQQLTENSMVKRELDLLTDESKVFKLVGPVLIKQDMAEATANVGKRIEYIAKETERLEATLKALESKATEKEGEIMKLRKRGEDLAKTVQSAQALQAQ